ncbi:hypothetical protein Q4Q52_14175 [Shewanella sp. SP1S2-4]|nr:hypothetical protein [Shewanella sp. SP1S2-4]MDT3320900.1 hypothetical protein [Shewanella sp. SP1S2-4]
MLKASFSLVRFGLSSSVPIAQHSGGFPLFALFAPHNDKVG